MSTHGSPLGDRVRRYREVLGYSLSDLARESGVSRSYLYQVESGESSPTEEKLLALANALGVTVPALLGLDEETVDIPQSLRDFAAQDHVPNGDIRMLARISYRGKQPTSVDAWRLLYMAVKTATASGVRERD